MSLKRKITKMKLLIEFKAWDSPIRSTRFLVKFIGGTGDSSGRESKDWVLICLPVDGRFLPLKFNFNIDGSSGGSWRHRGRVLAHGSCGLGLWPLSQHSPWTSSYIPFCRPCRSYVSTNHSSLLLLLLSSLCKLVDLCSLSLYLCLKKNLLLQQF